MSRNFRVFEFEGLHHYPSECGVDIFPESEEKVVVVASQLPTNQGTSVTNAWPQLADKIAAAFGLNHREVVWIEHYPERGHGSIPESFDLVYLQRANGHFIMRQDGHPWKRLTTNEVAQLTQGCLP